LRCLFESCGARFEFGILLQNLVYGRHGLSR
jgi:hypothetical protein